MAKSAKSAKPAKSIKSIKRCKKKATPKKKVAPVPVPVKKKKVAPVKKKKKVAPVPVKKKKKVVPAAASAKTWTEVIKDWKKGENLPQIKSSVFWETSRIHSGGESEFIQKVKPATKHLPMKMRADSTAFRKYLDGATTPVKFSNLDKSAVLVSPPDNGKNFSHIATFYKNSTAQEKKDLWKKVAKAAEKEMKKGKDVFVSTHGTNVPWLHVRIESKPKYYVSSLKDT
jgi:hypothetical protein